MFNLLTFSIRRGQAWVSQATITIALFATLFPCTLLGQQPSTENYTQEELRQHFRNVADGYEIVIGDSQLKLRSQPLQHWQNPVRRMEQGALFVWQKNGRPQILGSVFTYGHKNATFCRHEMISLADAPFESTLDGVVVWAPNRPGLTWKPMDKVSPPAGTMTRRLLQLRTMARTFEGTLRIPNKQPSALTLIPQPLHRYETAKEGVIDGAIFSLAVATDPEIFLLIEARQNKDTSIDWHYAAARSHYFALELRKDGEIVWEAPTVTKLQTTNAGQLPWMNAPYFTFYESKPLPAPETLR